MDFSAHTTPYILAAYAVSVIAIGALVAWRMARLKKAQADEKAAQD
ncbi:hypothetical protein [Hyphococcus sp.]|jgi:hypothetical protein